MLINRRELIKTLACSLCLPSFELILPDKKNTINLGHCLLDIDQINPCHNTIINYNKDLERLKTHMKNNGILEPLTALCDEESESVELIHGYARLHVAYIIGLVKDIPVLVKAKKDYSVGTWSHIKTNGEIIARGNLLIKSCPSKGFFVDTEFQPMSKVMNIVTVNHGG
jgi:hypothetical protein